MDLVVCLLVGIASQAVSPVRAIVEGDVVNGINHAGIAEATVTLTASASSPGESGRTYQTTTDALGAFRITGLRPGEYRASFEAHGFLPPPPTHVALRPFRIGPLSDAVHLDIEMTPCATLGGRVIDAEDRPASNVQVELDRARGGYGPRATTDKEGRFVLDAVPPGIYLLLARPIQAGSIAAEKPERISALPPPRAGTAPAVWAPTYFPRAAERSGAERIVIRAGTEMTNYEVRLLTLPVYRVQGFVFDDGGKPAAHVPVTLRAADPWELPEAEAESGEDGAFRFPSVRPGDWRFVAELRRNDTLLKGFAGVSVTDHDLDPIQIELSAPFVVNGFVERDEPRDAESQRKVTGVSLTPVGGDRGHAVVAFHEQDGALHIKGVYPGRYKIEPVGFTPGYYLQSVFLADRDVIGQSVDLTDGSLPIRVIYRSNAPRVRGTVEKGEGATVVLVPRDEAFLDRQFIRSARCEQGGRFEVGSLRPGEYSAFAFDRVDFNALEDPAFLRGLASGAETVRAKPGDIVTIDLELITWPE